MPHTLMPSHGNPLHLLQFHFARRLRLLILSGPKEKEPKYYCPSKSPVNEPPARFPNRGPMERVAPKALFYPSVGFPSKHGLPIKQNLTFSSKTPVKKCPLHGPRRVPLWKEMLRFRSQLFSHSFISVSVNVPS